jgi:LCP family protein required for cell wall assembly
MHGRVMAAWAVFFLAVSITVGYALKDQHFRSWLATPVSMIQAIVAPDPERLFGKPAIRVLIVGLDYDYDSKDIESSKTSRSDIIMAVNLDFHNHRISELSVPRDMVAVLPDGRRAKINQAQSEGGIRESEAVVANWLGTPPFDRYVVLRIDATKDLIDALGGVDVEVENSDALRHAGPNGPVDYDDSWGHLHVHLRPGKQHLNGAQAVGYARFRHDWCSDPCRIMRQQQVIHSIVDKVQHDHLDAIVHAKALLDVARKDIETSLTSTEQLAILMAFARMSPRDIRTAQVPYVASIDLPDYGDSILPDEAKKRELVASMLLSPEEAALNALPPSLVHVTVLNATNVSGLAGRFADDLQNKGFTIAKVGDASQYADVTQLYGATPTSPSVLQVRTFIGARIPNATVAPFPPAFDGGQDDVMIVLGRDAARAHGGNATPGTHF